MENRFKGIAAVTAGAVAAMATQFRAAAQDTAAAGNGGTADASADGGAVAIGDVNSGLNSGNAIAVGNVGDDDHGDLVCDKWGKCWPVDDDDGGAVAIAGGDVSSSTSIDISADGGTAIADASGGDFNFAFVS